MDKPSKRISVVICAYTLDRWDDLCEAIASLREQSRSPDEVVLVIDHNPELLARCIAAFPGIRVVANNSAQGLSGGRNTGIAWSNSDFVAFLDDDATADRDWLRASEMQFDDERVLGVVSRIEPRWGAAKPGWFPDEFLWVVGCSFNGSPAGPKSEVRNVLGGAMMVRRELFETIGGFSHKLGRTDSGASLLSCEETELCIRARRTYPDGKFVAITEVSIHHKVPRSRLTLRYFCRRTYAEGLSKAYLAALCGGDILGTERNYVFRVLTKAVFRNLGSSIAKLSPHPLARIGAIALGLACAASGFRRGRRVGRTLANLPQERPPLPSRQEVPVILAAPSPAKSG